MSKLYPDERAQLLRKSSWVFRLCSHCELTREEIEALLDYVEEFPVHPPDQRKFLVAALTHLGLNRPVKKGDRDRRTLYRRGIRAAKLLLAAPPKKVPHEN